MDLGALKAELVEAERAAHVPQAVAAELARALQRAQHTAPLGDRLCGPSAERRRGSAASDALLDRRARHACDLGQTVHKNGVKPSA